MEREPWRAAGRRLILSIAAALTLAAVIPAQAATSSDISSTPSILSFRYQIGDPLPAAQSLQFKSTGTALTVALTPAVSRPSGSNWLSVSTNGGKTPLSVKVYVNPTGLAAGVYQGSIDATASGAGNSPKSVPVTLEVGNAPATLAAAPATLGFTFVTGTTAPAAKVITLSSSGVPVSATIAVSGAWIKAQPSGSITLVGLPATVQVTADPTGLAPGSYSGKVTFASATAVNKTVVVAVTLDVSAGAPSLASTVWPAGVVINSAATTITLNGLNFFATTAAAVNGTSTGVTTAYISPTTMLVTIPASMLVTAGNLSITVTTPPPGGGPSLPATFVVYPATPQLQAVASVASYDTASISPGEIVAIYGVGLAGSAAVFQATGSAIPIAWPATGPQTSVAIDGAAAPLLYVSPTQLTCIVPYALTSKLAQNVNVVVTYNGNASTELPDESHCRAPGRLHPGRLRAGTGRRAQLQFHHQGLYRQWLVGHGGEGLGDLDLR